MKGIYLAAFRAMHPNYDIVYQDINGKRDIDGDMMPVFIYEIGRHTYWTNIFLNTSDIEQEINFHKKGKFLTEATNNRQGGDNVRKVIEVFLETIKERKEEQKNDC